MASDATSRATARRCVRLGMMGGWLGGGWMGVLAYPTVRHRKSRRAPLFSLTDVLGQRQQDSAEGQMPGFRYV